MNKKILTYMHYLAPAFIFIGFFIYYPTLMNFDYSLFSWSAFSRTRTFVGLANVKRIFADPVILIAGRNCTIFAVVSVIFQVGFALVIAAVLEDGFLGRFSTFFRTVFFLPSLMSITVCGLLFQLLLNPYLGGFNKALEFFGINASNIDLLGKSSTAIFTIVAISQWQYVGYTTMLFVVAIQKIPADLYEAATIDGAGPIRKFLYITVPQTSGMILVNMITTVTGAFKVFDEIYVMTGGGPGNSTQTLATYLYKTGFRNDEMGYASAIAILVFVITFVLSILQMRLMKLDVD